MPGLQMGSSFFLGRRRIITARSCIAETPARFLIALENSNKGGFFNHDYPLYINLSIDVFHSIDP